LGLGLGFQKETKYVLLQLASAVAEDGRKLNMHFCSLRQQSQKTEGYKIRTFAASAAAEGSREKNDVRKRETDLRKEAMSLLTIFLLLYCILTFAVCVAIWLRQHQKSRLLNSSWHGRSNMQYKYPQETPLRKQSQAHYA
jgi:hypothetical protein